MTDLVIRGGTVFDGLGSEGVRADVRVAGDRIVEVGNVPTGSAKEVDATGCFVTPGFVDGHTHLDAQIFWDPYAGSLTAHGVTSAVMGNCGFTLGPGTEDQADLVLRSIERAEDMSRAAIQRGVPWSWTDFVGYLDAVDELPKALNLCAQIGHSALRASVMGERAFTDPASESEVEEMRTAVRAAIEAGALGLSTSRSHAHVTVAGNPVASRIAEWGEVVSLVMAMKEAGSGLFQLAPERPSEPEQVADYQARLKALAISSGRPVTFMVGGQEEQLAAVDQVVASGGRAIGQVHVRGFENIFGFKTRLPFDKLPTWSAVRSKATGEQRKAFEDPELRLRLVEEALGGDYGRAVGAEVRAPQYDRIMVISDPEVSLAEIARERGASSVEVMIDLALNSDFEQLFRQPISEMPTDLLLTGLRHPNTVIAASDSGAHISQILDSNIPTYFLAHWVRSQQDFSWSEGIHMLTGRPAGIWGLEGRGVLQNGNPADLVVFDPETIGCGLPIVVNDLPDGGPRLDQSATGIRATIVNGRVTSLDGETTGDTPGVLLRSGKAA